jgi:predicted alpha/beta hydrolase
VSDAIRIDDVSIAARDGYQLAATVFVPAGEPRGSVIINSATAVPRKIYRGFAGYLAKCGVAALTFDYRGIGGSRPASLRGFPARMRDWATLDAAGVIDHARKTWPSLPISVVGHSFGGQAVGLAPNNAEITCALLIAAQAGYWRLFISPEKYRVYAIMRLIGPPIAHAMGYVPGRLGLGVDLPKGVFLEWSDWVARPRYFFDDPTLTALENFPRYRGRLRAVGLSDDPWATPATIELLLSGFTGTRPEHRQIDPRDVGAHKIGHFGFFRHEHRKTLWRDAALWLSDKA